MSSINIDSLSEEELVELNHKIVARLRFLGQMRSHTVTLDFRIGEKVKFQPTGRPGLIGTLTRCNKKTVTFITESGEHWNVAPGLLSRLESRTSGNPETSSSTVVQFGSCTQETNSLESFWGVAQNRSASQGLGAQPSIGVYPDSCRGGWGF
jgi:hypothetical protein